MSTNPNDMAFPVMDASAVPNGQVQLGLTKREYFAGQIMQAMCSRKSFRQATLRDVIAQCALLYADALIAELSKVQP